MVFKDYIMGEIFPLYYISGGRVCKAHGRLCIVDSTRYNLFLYDAKRVAKSDYLGRHLSLKFYNEFLDKERACGYFISLDDAYAYLLNKYRKEKMHINQRILMLQQQHIKDKKKYGIGEDTQ